MSRRSIHSLSFFRFHCSMVSRQNSDPKNVSGSLDSSKPPKAPGNQRKKAGTMLHEIAIALAATSKRLLEQFPQKEEEEKNRLKLLTPEQIKTFHQNPAKNRAKDIVCLEDNRFTLKDGLTGNYIHASYIDGLRNQSKKYIATQAPWTNSVVDFWRMVWQSEATLIVCLTNMKDLDSGRTSCYWPQQPTEIHRFGPVMVRNLAFREQDTWVETLLEIAWRGRRTSRRVTHLMYNDWEEKRAPSGPESVIKFRQKMRTVLQQPIEVKLPLGCGKEENKVEDTDTPPIIVHCNNGAGRTGAFITLDICMEEMENHGEYDIIDKVLDHVRSQRPGSLETGIQYVCIYQAHMIYAMRLNKNLNFKDFKDFQQQPVAD